MTFEQSEGKPGVNNGPVTASLRAPGGVEVLLGALAMAAVANLVVILVTGGYNVRVAGVPIKAHTLERPLLIAIVLFLVRWLAATRRVGLKDSLVSLWPWGPVAIVSGLAAFAIAAARGPIPLGAGQPLVAAALLLGFLFAYLAYGPGYPRMARLLLSLGFVAISWGLGDSVPRPDAWPKSLHFQQRPYADAEAIPADKEGLIFVDGSSVQLRKFPVNDDWRDAAVVSAGGFFAPNLDLSEKAALAFSAAAAGGAKDVVASVSLVTGSARKILWRQEASEFTGPGWLDVSLATAPPGKGQLVFEANSESGAGAVAFANPRIVRDASDKPNIVLVVADALRADRLGCYGYGRPTSPELDSMSRSGTVFENCIVQAPWTLPSLGSLFTSLYPSAHGMVSFTSTLSSSLDTMTESLRRAGYYTAAIQGNPTTGPDLGLAQGFNEYAHPGAKVFTAADKGAYTSAEAITGAAADWISKHADRPFFLYLHYMDLHKPFAPDAARRAAGGDASSRYDAQVSRFSAQFARLCAVLADERLTEKTVVVLTADHGEQLLERGRTQHGSDLHSEELHVPLVMWVPRRGRGARVASLVGLIDVAPTLLELAGAQPLPAAEGISLLPAVDGKPVEDREIMSELLTYRPLGQFIVSITTGKYRFILSNPKDGTALRRELYDLENDAGEHFNVAAGNEKIAASMRDKVDAFLAAHERLRSRLVPVEKRSSISNEKLRKLVALGYVTPDSGEQENDGK